MQPQQRITDQLVHQHVLTPLAIEIYWRWAQNTGHSVECRPQLIFVRLFAIWVRKHTALS